MSKTKICSKCGKELPLTGEYFTVNNSSKDGFHYLCKLCRGFKSYGYSLKYINTVLKEKGLKRCKYCGKDLPIESYKMVGKTRRIEYCEECEHIHKKKKSEYDRQYLIDNKEYKKEYYNQWKEQGGKDIRYENEQKRQELLKSLKHDLTDKEYSDTLSYFNNSCAYCGIYEEECKNKYGVGLSKEHIIPIVKNGEFTKNNIIPSCAGCNSKKHIKDLAEFYEINEEFTTEKYTKILDFQKRYGG